MVTIKQQQQQQQQQQQSLLTTIHGVEGNFSMGSTTTDATATAMATTTATVTLVLLLLPLLLLLLRLLLRRRPLLLRLRLPILRLRRLQFHYLVVVRSFATGLPIAVNRAIVTMTDSCCYDGVIMILMMQETAVILPVRKRKLANPEISSRQAGKPTSGCGVASYSFTGQLVF